MHAVALWIAFAHLVQREDLGINISPRLAIQAPDTDCGKTVLLEAVACGVPRPDMLVSISASSLFRSVDADKNTSSSMRWTCCLMGAQSGQHGGAASFASGRTTVKAGHLCVRGRSRR